MKLTLLDLVKEIGLDNIVVESLAHHIQGAERIKIGKGKDKTTITKVEFLTDQMEPGDLMPSASPKMCGMMVWVPMEMFKKVQEKFEVLPDEPEVKDGGN